jgi:hypothetical protein
MSDNKTWIKAYKGFDKDLKCKGRQYTEGVEDHVSDVAKLCKEGVHACERPLDVFRYYVPADSVYHEVELAGVLDEHQEDSKIRGTDIKVKGKLDIAGLIKAQIKYTKSHCTNEYNAENGKPASAGYCGAASAGARGAASAGDGGAASAGYCGAASAGDCGAASAGVRGAASAGDCGAASAGYCGAASAGARGAASAGYCGAASAGYCGAASAGARGAASAGYCGAASAGDRGAASAGDCGAATSKGKSSVGENGIACSRSYNARVKGDMGAVLVCAEENEYNYDIKTWAAGVVDGVNILPDVWYKAENGRLVPADD